jgi:hypothetical protein
MIKTEDMKLYREIKVSERLPDKGEYMTNSGWLEFDVMHNQWGFLSGLSGEWEYVNDVSWWLELIDITEEDIEAIIHQYSITRRGIKEQAKAILSKLKGE